MKMRVNNSLFHCFLAIGVLEDFLCISIYPHFLLFLFVAKRLNSFAVSEPFKRNPEGSKNIIKNNATSTHK